MDQARRPQPGRDPHRAREHALLRALQLGQRLLRGRRLRDHIGQRHPAEAGPALEREEVVAVKTPNPGGTKSGGLNEIFALGCGAADNCWGAGSYGSTNPPGKNLNEILHWNGKTWTKTATPNPDGTKTGAGNQLDAATCLSSANCWAVGNFGSTTVGTGVGRNEACTGTAGNGPGSRPPTPEAPRPATSMPCWPCAAYRPATAGPSAP
jgi:hypothetical protein